MPSEIAAQLLLDFFVYSLIATAIAMPLYYFVRKSSPELGWNFHGNVPTSHLTSLDIIGVCVALLIPVSNVVLVALLPREILETAMEQSGETSPISMIIQNVLSQFFFADVVILFIVFRANLYEVFGLKHVDWKRVIISVFGGLVCIYIFATLAGTLAAPLLENIGEGKEPQAAVQMILDAKKDNPNLLYALAFMACIVAPVCEEILFRGYLYPIFKRYSCRLFATVLSGFIFGLIHASLTSLAPLVVVGIILAIIYEYSGSLWAPIITHSVFNTVNVLAMIFIVNGSDLPY